MNKEYNLAIALLQFKRVYKELTTASKALPDIDLTEMYPFYILDFEELTDNVAAWCNIHASNILRELPDKVDNPICTQCPDFRIGLSADGLCKAVTKNACSAFPFIIFSREQVAPFMAQHNDPVRTEDSDKEVYLRYVSKLEACNEERQYSNKEKDSCNMASDKLDSSDQFTGGPSSSGCNDRRIQDVYSRPAVSTNSYRARQKRAFKAALGITERNDTDATEHNKGI